MDRKELEKVSDFLLGEENVAYAPYFIGKSYLSRLNSKEVNIAPEIKHWHGAAADEAFAHLSLSVPVEGASNEWCEPVTEEEYKSLCF